MFIRRDAYGALPPAPAVRLDSGERAVRFYARDIHHFAWTASPDYRYEGALYRDTIPVHVLYEPSGEQGWGQGAAIEKEKRALAWLESIYGPYAYPQVLGTQRLEGGATEFPMMVMYGSTAPSIALVLHETGHIYSYGMLANNEWRSGWMDEGLTSYQTAWALNQTPLERAMGLGPKDPPPPTGYRAHAVRPPRWQQNEIDEFDARAHRARGADRHAGIRFQRVRHLPGHGVLAGIDDVQRAARDSSSTARSACSSRTTTRCGS